MAGVSANASLKILRFLNEVRGVTVADFGDKKEKRLLLSGRGNKKLLCQQSVFDALYKASLIERNADRCWLHATGEKRLQRADAVVNGDLDGGFAAQHANQGQRTIHLDGVAQTVTVNRNESPLARLKARKGADGRPWINEQAYEAGERLRHDFTKSHLMQNVTMNWDMSMAGNKLSSRNSKVDLQDGAASARQRFEKALECVGPDLGGVVTDVCCFLKGLESVERERRWPPRSAKLMLRTALGLLARHYGIAAGRG